MKERSMTEKALASASGVSLRTIGNFLRPRPLTNDTPGSRGLPSGTLANFFKLAMGLGVEPWEMLCDQDWRRFHHAVEQAHLERTAQNPHRTGR